MPDLLKAFILGIIEGVTEFLPVSSTGHLKLAEHWMGELVSKSFADNFDIFIQIGAILAVVVYFRRKILYLLGLGGPEPLAPVTDTSVQAPTDPTPVSVVPGVGGTRDRVRVLALIALATAPLAVGYLAAKKSEAYLAAHPAIEPLAIAGALGIGGVLMILIEVFRPRAKTESMEAMTWKQALIIGLCQILAAVFPGTSRSAATIMPALCLGVSRPVAAEFSFFLAIPAMTAAAGVKLIKFLKSGDATTSQLLLLGIGTVTAFAVAYVVVAGFMGFIRRYSFVPFGVYRIVLAVVVVLALR